MMGPGHAVTGAAGGLIAACAADVAGTPLGIAGALLVAGLGAGGALIPDLDHDRATVSRSFGPLTVLLARGLNRVSARVYDATATARDEDRDGGHRGLTHTWPFALALGGLVACAAVLWGRPVVPGAVFVLLSLALRGLFAWIPRRFGWFGTAGIAAALTWWGADALPPDTTWAWLGGAVAAGCLIHDWGDSLTEMGCPWLWPIPIAGQRWYPIGTPTALRFPAGQEVERRIVMPVLVILTCGLAVPALMGVRSALAAVIG
jgi:membrane-bound metal-dependent hydrolase YbcI (DUF457 family)